MSNFTLSALNNLCLVTDSEIKHHQEEPILTREEQACIDNTKAALNTIRYSPRAATMQLIIDYAATSAEQE
ncbi:hypothetical protein [Chitinophaga sp. MM2321]|uniref:hypothetical protein n=1 Tax=Chitinophaga sp. MM2321 TaxID=3137178 RepID=UPI0032D57841